jgi:hypothetical protein
VNKNTFGTLGDSLMNVDILVLEISITLELSYLPAFYEINFVVISPSKSMEGKGS